MPIHICHQTPTTVPSPGIDSGEARIDIDYIDYRYRYRDVDDVEMEVEVDIGKVGWIGVDMDIYAHHVHDF